MKSISYSTETNLSINQIDHTRISPQRIKNALDLELSIKNQITKIKYLDEIGDIEAWQKLVRNVEAL